MCLFQYDVLSVALGVDVSDNFHAYNFPCLHTLMSMKWYNLAIFCCATYVILFSFITVGFEAPAAFLNWKLRVFTLLRISAHCPLHFCVAWRFAPIAFKVEKISNFSPAKPAQNLIAWDPPSQYSSLIKRAPFFLYIIESRCFFLVHAMIKEDEKIPQHPVVW